MKIDSLQEKAGRPAFLPALSVMNPVRLCWPIPQVGVLKVEVLDVESKPFTSQRDSGSWRFPPNCVALCRAWGSWQSVSHSASLTCFSMVIFSFAQCVEVA